MEIKMTQTLLAIGVSLTVVVSPEVQTMLGNGSGQLGFLFTLPLACAAIAQLSTLRLFSPIRYSLSSPPTPRSQPMVENSDHPTTLFFFLASRVVFMATLSTIILATAGFVFNEVFYYWFPNFAFSFLLLGVLLTANMISSTFAARLQVILVITVLFAMAILCIAGFMSTDHVRIAGQEDFTLRALLLPFMMIIGTELFIFSPGCGQTVQQRSLLGKHVSVALILTMFILMLWGGSMLQLVSPEKLADSFNPHMKAARQALSQPGRIIAATMIISGVAATVNGLLLTLTSQAKYLARHGHLPLLFTKGGSHFPLPLFVLAACPATLLALGMAGHDTTEVYIRGSLLFWLLHYCIMHLSACKKNVQNRFLHLFTSLLLAIVTAGLINTDPQKQLLLQSLLHIGIACAFLNILLFFSTQKPLSH